MFLIVMTLTIMTVKISINDEYNNDHYSNNVEDVIDNKTNDDDDVVEAL